MSCCLSHGHHIVTMSPWMTTRSTTIFAALSDLCIHRVIYAYIAWSMHTLHDLCIHRVIYAYIAWSMHTLHDLWYISCYTSHDLCIHQVTYGYIAWSMIQPLLMEYFYKRHPIVSYLYLQYTEACLIALALILEKDYSWGAQFTSRWRGSLRVRKSHAQISIRITFSSPRSFCRWIWWSGWHLWRQWPKHPHVRECTLPFVSQNPKVSHQVFPSIGGNPKRRSLIRDPFDRRTFTYKVHNLAK